MIDLRTWSERYESALQDYLAGVEEPALLQAYELGRQAFVDELGIQGVATVHGEALVRAVRLARTPEESVRVTNRATAFLLESVSAFEMIGRGFREANATLRSVNATLGQRTAELEAANQELARDIAERKRIEIELDKYRQHLEDLVHARTGELEAANAQLQAEMAERQQAEEALQRQTRYLAGVEERQRLARDLHDSVSQALYCIGLGVQTARVQLYRDTQQAAAALEFVRSQIETGLSDIRTLIFDLRVDSLAGEGLVAALTKRAVFIENRQNVTVHTDLCDEPDVPFEVKDMLYGIAREALHNTVKHARATEVEVKLAHQATCLMLEVRDNGIGFDPTRSYPGHWGLESMRERAIDLGATLTIESAAGQGTRISVQVPPRLDAC